MKANYGLFLLTAVGYLVVGYGIPRSSFIPFISIYLALFGIYGYWCYNAKNLFQAVNWKHYVAAAVLLRAIFLVATPELSDDFWRYLWDGRLFTHGINPYRYFPEELLNQAIYEEAHLGQLFPYLNSPKFYSVYPPITQFIFAAASFFFPDNVLGSLVVLHSLILSFDVITIVCLIKILELLKKPTYLAFFYAFNPLVILELTGNLHTEGAMIAALAVAFYLLLSKRLLWSAFAFAIAVGAKLLPLMFMPLILHRLWRNDGVKYCLIVGVVNLGLFLLFFDLELLQKIRTSMSLYFAHFEFNASIYYMLRYGVLDEYWLLWDYEPYFRGIGPITYLLQQDLYLWLKRLLPIIDVTLILYLSSRISIRANWSRFLNSFLWIYSIHFFFATTIHPWYIAPLVFFSVLAKERYALVWSCGIGLTYITYAQAEFVENSWLIALEYCFVFAVLYKEYRAYKTKKKAVQPVA